MEYELKDEAVEVPKNTGKNGFLHLIGKILDLPRVQGITIDSRGKVNFRRFVKKGEEADVGPTISFEQLMPWACVRNGRVDELPSKENNPPFTITKMFQAVSRERLFPVAWVTGANTTLWEWFRNVAGIEMENKEEFFGLQVLTDRHIDDYVLVLAAAEGKTDNIVDVKKSFKVIMPQRKETRKEDALDRAGSGEGGPPVTGGAGPVQALGVPHGTANGGATQGPRGGSPGHRGSPPG